MEAKEARLGDLRIHGDNIIECERLLFLTAESLGLKATFIDGPLYSPLYILTKNGAKCGTVRLFPGYLRWGVNLADILAQNGVPLREAPDAILTKVKDDTEVIIFSVEFSNALPAGNNAWQRTGRAVASAAAKIPYLYFAEIGGMELDENRKIKAMRYPNPIVPFSYITLGTNYGSISVPIYSASPTSSSDFKSEFLETFGIKEGKTLIRYLLLGIIDAEPVEKLKAKTLMIAEMLSDSRKRKRTLHGSEWKTLLSISNPQSKAKWLEKTNMHWSKKIPTKVKTTVTLKELLTSVRKSGAIMVGAADIPICLIGGGARRKTFISELKRIYGNDVPKEFYNWISSGVTAFLIVWITGFKPRGDDSRPDRGLVPLARMLFGKDIDILTIVYGPAKPSTWSKIIKSPVTAANDNGLWQTIFNLSNGLLIDSTTAAPNPIALKIEQKEIKPKTDLSFPLTSISPKIFSEQDVDSVTHLTFKLLENSGFFECMCNPPGGDWSGLSFLDFETEVIYRWTSLSRVSKNNGKRPDHVIEFKSEAEVIVMSIESKESALELEDDIGPRLNRYTKDLIETSPNAKGSPNEPLMPLEDGDKFTPKVTYLSAGNCCFNNIDEFKIAMAKCKLDVIFAFQFSSDPKQKIRLHVFMKNKTKTIETLIQKIKSLECLEVKIH